MKKIDDNNDNRTKEISQFQTCPSYIFINHSDTHKFIADGISWWITSDITTKAGQMQQDKNMGNVSSYNWRFPKMEVPKMDGLQWTLLLKWMN